LSLIGVIFAKKLNDMKKLILPFLILSNIIYGQIKTTKVLTKVEQVDKTPYDSTKNFLVEEPQKYIGQELYLKGMAESLRKYGYSGFVLDYKEPMFSNKKNIYKCCESYNSIYSELAEKYFTVLEVIKHPKGDSGNSSDEYLYGKKWFLKLKEKESGDTVYFEYDSQYEHSFPFIVVGFYDKLKKNCQGKKFVLGKSSTDFYAEEIDINTGQKVIFNPGEKWECIDISVEEKYYYLSLLLKDKLGQTITINYEQIIGDNKFHDIFTSTENDTYEKKFGKMNWTKILNNEVVIGFTEEMVILSWGKPEKINKASYGDQWVYDEKYLYFEFGKLKSFN